MKLTTVLLIATFLQVSATGFAQKVTFVQKDATIKQVFDQVYKQTGYSILWTAQNLRVDKKINANFHNTSLEDVMKQCLDNLDLNYAIEDKSVVISKKASTFVDKIEDFLAIPIHIHGIVKDSTDKPIAGATVNFFKKSGASSYSATAFGTTENGTFNLDANEGDYLIISYIGYENYRVNITRNMPPLLNIVLHVSTSRLQEVVVQTGYQTLSKERATGSFEKPNMQTFHDRSSSMDIISRLEGQIAGYNLVNNAITGQTNLNTFTGATPAIASIRGQTSVQLNSQPLFVVDGVVVTDFSALNLDNVDDITVLKDAAAAAIYGAQAANGVLVVTTKTGRKNQKLKVAYTGFIDFNGKPDIGAMSKYYLNSAQYVALAKQLFNPTAFPYSNYNSIYNANTINPVEQALYDQNSGAISAGRANAILDSISNINNTAGLKRDLYRNAYTTNHTISMSGGTNNYTVFASVGYTNIHTSDIGQNNNSYKIALNQTFTPNDRFSFSLNAQLADNVSAAANTPFLSGNVLPFIQLKDASGNLVNMPWATNLTPDIIKQYSASSGIDLNTYSPLTDVDYQHSNNNEYAINLVGNATVKLWKGLKYIGTFGYDVAPTTQAYLQDYRSLAYRTNMLNFTVPGTPPTYLIPANEDYYQQANNNQVNWTVRNQLAYNYSGRDGKDLVALQVGQEAKDLHQYSQATNVYGYDPQLQSISTLNYQLINSGTYATLGPNGAFLNPPFRFTDYDTRYSSYFALASYTLNHKYSVDLSWRRDHSNLFGSDISAQNKPAYSIGGKWDLKSEKFMPALSWLDALKIRGTYGITGNSPRAGGGQQLDAIRAEQIFGFVPVAGPGYAVSSPADKTLSWEGTRTTNLGIDFIVLHSRLSGSVEYYHKDTKDLIGSAPINIFTGYTSSTSNIGELVNNGINATLNSINITGEHFTWQSSFVFAHNTNKLLSYSSTVSTSGSSFITATPLLPGYSINSLFAYKWAGLNSSGDPQVYNAAGTKLTSNSTLTPNDLVYIGTTTPQFVGGFGNRFRYNQFTLSVNLTYSLGGVMHDLTNQTNYGNLIAPYNYGTVGFNGNIPVSFLNRWQNPGDENTTNVPRYTTNFGVSGQLYSYANINVVSASFIKMNDATLSYNLSSSVARFLNVQSASVRLQLNNTLLWTKNSQHLDPQTQSYFGGTVIPVGRNTVTVGANINF